MPFPKTWAKPAAAAFALAFAAALCAQRMTTMLPGTVKNFELPNFNENTGAKEWELFGEKASYKSDTRIDVESFKLLLFEDGARGALKAAITSRRRGWIPSKSSCREIPTYPSARRNLK